MKVIHLPFTYYPDPVGGTETYVAALIQQMRQQGVDGVVVAPADEPGVYSVQGTTVCRLAVSSNRLTLRELYGEGDARVAEQFTRLLDHERPDLVHMHAFTSAVSLQLVRIAQGRSIPVVFTYHTPSVSCQRGTLLRWGRAVCDGQMKRRCCTQCTLHGLGLNRAASCAIGLLPRALAQRVGEAGWRGRLCTALRMRELVELRHGATRALMREADAIVVLCTWTCELLERNGVSPGKIIVSHHGLPRRGQRPPSRYSDRAIGQPLRLVYLGRLHPTKGVDLLVRAVRAAANAAVELDVYGIVQSPADERYRTWLINLSADDGRIRFLEPVPVEQVHTTLEGYDLLAVPSQWLETGPLVVLEAFNAGIPVLGSALGGIAELVQHGVNGLLVHPFHQVDAWRAMLETLVTGPGMVGRLAKGVTPPRGMDDVAEEMRTVYERLA